MSKETINVLYDILKDVYENYYEVAKERGCDDILNGVIDDIADRSFFQVVHGRNMQDLKGGNGISKEFLSRETLSRIISDARDFLFRKQICGEDDSAERLIDYIEDLINDEDADIILGADE